MVLPNSEQKRLELVERHLKAVKQCDKSDLRRVYEDDYNAFMNIQTQKPHREKEKPHHAQKRPGGAIGNNKRYRRF